LAIIGESVRWGDSKIHPARTKDDDWIPLINSINALLLGRTPIVLNQLKARGWYPNVDAPDFSINGTPQHGGEISSGAELTISAPVGTIYYTLDGTDPRSPGGAIAGGAGVYDGAIALTDTTFVKARVLEGPEWSAVCEAMFQVMESSPEDIIITELLPNANGEDDYKEWFEIYNTIGWPIDINGWVISDNGTDSHTINNGAPLIVPAKGYLILGESTDPGLNGGAPVDYAYGPDDVTLGNGGDEIILSQGGTVIHAVGYEAFDNAPISVLDTGLDANPGLAIGMARDYCNGAEPLWQVQISHYGSNGDTGTPGANNDGVEVCAPPEPTPEPTPEITTSAEMWDFYY